MAILLMPWRDKKGKMFYLPIHSFALWQLFYEKAKKCEKCPLHREKGCIADRCVLGY